MAKEEKPLEYQGRISDTKGLAQRIDLEYLQHPARREVLLRRLSWILPLVAAIGVIPFVFGLGGGKRAFSNGPVSRAHAIFENRCENCHSQNFSRVQDTACNKCHDGPAHPAKLVDTAKPNTLPRCAQCHIEHRGMVKLADVDNRNCTACHANLKQHAAGITIHAISITSFRTNRHPEFSPAGRSDDRPLRLNHAIHMPKEPKTLRGVKLPIRCSECHVTNTGSPKGDLLPVTFEQNCSNCHKRELEFDVYQLLGPDAPPAPHNKDPKLIHDIIAETYREASVANPAIVQRPLGRDLEPMRNAAAWLARVTADSEQLVYRKCEYCHEIERQEGGFPVVRKVNRIEGRYVASKPEGEPWFVRSEFSHRAHRAIECTSCHTTARASTKTPDVLIPKMPECLRCHGSSGKLLDNCAQCHLYHNKLKESDKDRRPIEQLLSGKF